MTRSRTLTVTAALSTAAAAVSCVIGAVLIQRGFDFTDTGFYLLTTAFPDGVRLRMSFFDYFNQPLYALAGERVGGLRLTAILLLYATSVLTIVFTGRYLDDPRQRRLFFAISPLLLIAALLSVLYLPTPAYNFWGLVALQFAWMGLWLWVRRPLKGREAAVAAGLLGLGAALLLGARPTTIAGLLLIFLVATVLRGGLPPKPLLWLLSGLAAVLPVGLYLLALAHANGLTLTGMVEAGDLALHWKAVTNPAPLELTAYISASARLFAEAALLLFAFWICLGGAAVFGWRTQNQRLVAGWVALAWIVGTGSALWLTQRNPHLMGTIAVQFFLMSAATLLNSETPDGVTAASQRRVWIGAGIAISLLVIASFGTNVEYSLISGMAYFFGCMAVLLLLTRPQRRGWLQALLLSAFFLANIAAVYHGLRVPRREDVPRWAMTAPVEIRQGRDEILVSPAMATYIADFTRTADEAGFQPGTPVMDFTGHRPGLVYAMGGRSPAYAWFLGGYPGSTAAVDSLLERWSAEDLRRAWLITAEGDALRALPTSLLNEHGLAFPAGYERLGTFRDPIADETYVLWKPTAEP